jgi:phosphomannomutase
MVRVSGIRKPVEARVLKLSIGGLTVRRHILGKDGIYAAALIVEMLARTGKKLSQIQAKVWKLTLFTTKRAK